MLRFAPLLVALFVFAGCDSNGDIVRVCDNESVEIEVEEIVEGTSPARANATDQVLVNYSGTLTNGDEFDSGEEVLFRLTSVISGFREGVTGMRIGGKRRITIPPYRGYRTQELDGIPACSTLIFEVELLDILS